MRSKRNRTAKRTEKAKSYFGRRKERGAHIPLNASEAQAVGQTSPETETGSILEQGLGMTDKGYLGQRRVRGGEKEDAPGHNPFIVQDNNRSQERTRN